MPANRMLGRSSGNHDWLLANAIACVSCGFHLRNARNASDCVWMETGRLHNKPVALYTMQDCWQWNTGQSVKGAAGVNVGPRPFGRRLSCAGLIGLKTPQNGMSSLTDLAVYVKKSTCSCSFSSIL